jgi:cell division protein FtsB
VKVLVVSLFLGAAALSGQQPGTANCGLNENAQITKLQQELAAVVKEHADLRAKIAELKRALGRQDFTDEPPQHDQK